jgi:hypothetical protein
MAPRLDPKKRVGKDMAKNINKIGMSIDDNLKAMEDIGSAEFVVRDIEVEKIVPSA